MTKLLFERSRTTAIMVARRLSTVRDVDRIYLISGSAVAEQGKHGELMLAERLAGGCAAF
ncbi:MAG: hypothetical protein LBT36_01255 [Oscillospiraceae bacterium]|nr:hypothetical protein [Oscillospiraceae bacterium]